MQYMYYRYVTSLRFSRKFDILFYTYMGNFHIKQWGDKNCNSVKLKVKHNSKDFMVVKCGFSPYEIEHGPWNFT